ncbi:MAG: hypothetical protein HY700_18580 [Gemmatimonadetes bacterium]|nr:hypothetical protein [Gemmatimonadota bacterium]
MPLSPRRGALARPRFRTGETAQLVKQLTAIRPGRDWIISCYLDLTPDSRSRGGYLVELKNRIRAALTALKEMSRADRQAIERDLDRMVEAVRDPTQLPDTPGLALFACEGLGLFQSVALPRVRRTRLLVDRVPHLRELRAAEDEFGRVLTAVIDRAHARVFEVTAHGALERTDVAPAATRGGRFHSDRGGSPGWGEKDYHARITRERERHYESVMRALIRLDREHPARGVVVAGPQRQVAAMLPFLDGGLLHRLIGTARLNPTAVTPRKVQEATFALCDAHDREAERAEVRLLLDSIGEGWAVNGVQATMRALRRGQVRTLFVHSDTDIAEADEAIEEALGQRVRVVMVRDPGAAAALQHLGGLLRFK